MSAVLELVGVGKRYGGRVVLEGVSFDVQAGEIHALLGPNGAGKTTTLEIAEGLREADDGVVRFQGRPVRHGRVPAGMGVQLQASGLPATMTAGEALRFVGAYRGAEARPGLVERLELAGLLDTPYGALSVGQQRRLQLALALAHRPALVVLDEPTAGLDVASRAALHALLDEVRGEGTAIVLASHDMAEVEKLADRLTVLVRGRVVAHGTPREITRAGDPRTRIAVRTRRADPAALVVLDGAEALPPQDGYARYLSADPEASLRALLDGLVARGDALVDLRVERPSLEERFLDMTRTEAHP